MKFHDKITPEGTRDVLFEECTVRQRTQDIILKGLCEKGFHPVMTPTMEFYDLFGANRYFSQESMYKWTGVYRKELFAKNVSILFE